MTLIIKHLKALYLDKKNNLGRWLTVGVCWLMMSCVSEEQQITESKKLMADRKFKEAIALLNKVVEAHSQSAKAFNTRGVAYLELREYANADLDFEQAMKLDPTNYQPYFNRATSKGEQGRWDDALADINKAVQLQPDTSENYSKRGIILAATGRLQDAIKDFDKVISMKATDFNALYNRGNLYFQLQNLAGAEADFKKALSLNAASGKAFYGLGTVQLAQGQKDAACLSFKQAEKLQYADATAALKAYCP